MLLQTFPQFAIEPPVLVDWLPWHHTYGGSHNVGIALYNGGTLYIDEGKPIAKRFGQTLRRVNGCRLGRDEAIGAIVCDLA